MKLILFALLLITAQLPAMDADEIRTIAKKPHSRANLVPELRLYPEAREYAVTIHSGKPSSPREQESKLIVSEKTVDGRYIVSEAALGNSGERIIMVVTYDRMSSSYKKHVLLPNGAVVTSTGNADLKKRTITWLSVVPGVKPATKVEGKETHTDTKSNWVEKTLQGEKVVWISAGTAVKTR